MIVDNNSCHSKEYPYGAFCICGKTIHLKSDELRIGATNYIKCPVCGYVVGLTISDKQNGYKES